MPKAFVAARMPTGILGKWISEKGFGFIKPDDGSPDIFTHIRQLTNGDGVTPPPEGSRVTFEADTDLSKGKLKTSQWTLLSLGSTGAAAGAVGLSAGGLGGALQQLAQAQPAATATPASLLSGGFNTAPQFGAAAVAQPVQSQLITSTAQLGGSAFAGSTAPGVAAGAVAGVSGPTGTVKRWVPDKGYGFIQPDAGGESFFAHIRQCTNGDISTLLSEGARVTYQTEYDPKQGKVKAASWTVVGGAPGGNVDVMKVLQTAASITTNAMAAFGPGTPNSAVPQGALTGQPGQNPAMPPHVPPNVQSMEVEVPEKYLNDIIGPAASGLEDIKKRAGGDIRIDVSPATSGDTSLVKILGPEVSASLAMCLVLQRLSELC